MKYFYSLFCHSRMILSGILLVLFTSALYAQTTSIRLPAADSSANYRVLNSSNANLLRLNGDGGFYFSGTYGTGVVPATGVGTRLMWYPKKAALRAGTINSNQWDDINIGDYSVAFGGHTTAGGGGSLATGWMTNASGWTCTALGNNTTASAQIATALGMYTTASGDFSTAMGTYASTNMKLGAFIIGDYSTTITNSSANNEMTMRFAGGYRFFTNSAATVGCSLAAGGTSWATISDSTKKELFQRANGEYFLNSLAQLKLGSWNYKGQNVKSFRHYGPMAQEIFHYFGKDEFGIIGNETSLASADMDGIMMICLQALEKRTDELKTTQAQLGEVLNKLQYANQKISLMEKQDIERDKTISTLSEKIEKLSQLLSSSTKINQSQFTTNTPKEE